MGATATRAKGTSEGELRARMAERGSNFQIAGSAHLAWEHLDVPHRLEEVVDAIFALPPDLRPEKRWERPPIILNYVVATVFGRPFFMLGSKNADGTWATVNQLHPLETPA